jgi:hypothetical protein
MDLNLESHIRDVAEAPPAIRAGSLPTCSTILTPQLPTSAGPQRRQPWVASTNEHQSGEVPAPESTVNLEDLHGC